jgi:hypothetical protein
VIIKVIKLLQTAISILRRFKTGLSCSPNAANKYNSHNTV